MILLPLRDFDAAAHAVLDFLHQRFGFKLWMITRLAADSQVVLHSRDEHYGIKTGSMLSWTDSICKRMVAGHGPHIAPDLIKVPSYATAPTTSENQIGAYIGVPLTSVDGVLLGSMCAFDPERQPDSLAVDLDLVKLIAGLIAALLVADLASAAAARRDERLQIEAQTDALTGLYNRRAWDLLREKEEARCNRFGLAAAVVVLDLDGLKSTNDTRGHAFGDRLIKNAAQALRASTRAIDIVARLGGDEFGIIAVECDEAGVQALVGRVREALVDAQVRASIGVALREPSSGLGAAWKLADRKMYEEKSTR